MREGKQYVDAEVGTYLYGYPQKSKLAKSPFVRYLNYGQGKYGYWTYRHMILQLEDYNDCTQYMFPHSKSATNLTTQVATTLSEQMVYPQRLQ